MYTQIVAVNTCMIGMQLVSYLYYEPSYLMKILFYTMFGACFLAAFVHATCLLATIQKKTDAYLNRDTKYKLCVMVFGVLGGIIVYPIAISLFSKGIWFMYLCSVGLIVQFAMSYWFKIMYFNKFIISYTLSLLYLCASSDSYPLFNFSELCYVSIFIFVIYLAAVISASMFLLRKTSNQERIESIFEISNKSSTRESET